MTRLSLVCFATTAWLSGFAACALFRPVSGPSAEEVGVYDVRQLNCVDNASTRAAADTCRANVRAAWCQEWPTSVNCVRDAGTE